MEFPSVQGSMGHHIALHDGEHAEVSHSLLKEAIFTFVLRATNCQTSNAGLCAVTAEKLDTTGWNIRYGKLQKGDKDPFALRRSANCIIAYSSWKTNYHLNLHKMVNDVVWYLKRWQNYPNANRKTQVHTIFIGQFKPFLSRTKNIAGDVV